MKFTLGHRKLLCAAACLALPGAALAQDNAGNAINSATVAATNATAGPAPTAPMAADTGAADPFNTTAPIEGRLANSIDPERDDRDIPWGLLGLAGLAGLLGRKRNNDVHVDTRRDTPR